MQPLLLTSGEVIAVLARRVAAAQSTGLSHEQAVAWVSHELRLDPTKVGTLVPVPTEVAA